MIICVMAAASNWFQGGASHEEAKEASTGWDGWAMRGEKAKDQK